MPPIDVESESSFSAGEVAAQKLKGRTGKAKDNAATASTKRRSTRQSAIELVDGDPMDEDDDEEVVPTRKSLRSNVPSDLMDENEPDIKTSTSKNAPANEQEDDEDEDEEPGDVFIVEKIVDHRFDADGTVKYQVKWKGYEKRSDLTWEPVEHFEEGASDVLVEYHDKIGGQPVFKPAAKKRARPSKTGTPTSTGTGTDSAKGSKTRRGGAVSVQGTPSASQRADVKKPNWAPPSGSWEGAIQAVDTIEMDSETDTLNVFLHWNDGRKSKHPIEVCYKKCPQKMLHFYEQHLVFKEGEGLASPNA